MRRRTLLIGLAALVALALVGVGGVFLGRAITKPPAAPPAPSGQPSPQTPAGDCPPAAENATDGTLDQAPETEWIQATDRVWVPKTKGGPLKDGAGFGECFTPDAEGAVTAAYYYSIMADTSFEEAVRRDAFDAYIPDEDVNKSRTISNLLSAPERAPRIEGFALNGSVQKNRADVTVFLPLGKTAELVPIETRLAWVEGTWKVAAFTDPADPSTSGPNPMIRWKR